MAVAVSAGTGCSPSTQAAKQPMGHFEVKRVESPDDAPDEAKTIQVAYVFDRDLVNKEFQKSFKGGFDKNGIKVDEQLDARAHFEVSGAKITGTVTYVKKGMGRYSILDADLVAEAHYDADVQMDLDVKVKGDTKKATDKDWNESALHGKPYPLVKNMMPANIPIVGPLFLHAHFDLNAACEIGVEGQMHATAGVGIKGDVRLAAKYKKAGFENAEKPDEKKKFKFEAKAPNFELSPRPYLKVEGKQQSIKGWCSLQPTAVLLVENMIGASMIVEPWIELEAKRASTQKPWQLGAEVGFTVSAAPELRVFGRKIGKKKEFELMEVTLAKMTGPELGRGPGPKILGPVEPPKSTKLAPTAVAALDADKLFNAAGRGTEPSSTTAAVGSNVSLVTASDKNPSSPPLVASAGATPSALPSSSTDAPATPPTAPPTPSPAPSPPAPPTATATAIASPDPPSTAESDDAPSKPPAKSPRALKGLRANLSGVSRPKPVSRTPGLGGTARLFKKKG